MRRKLSHMQIIAVGFFLMIMTGTFLLMLPISSQGRVWTPFIDALFTATSASCVTGQVVKDTATYWSSFGHVVIITLIQIGGLGFMTIATLFFLACRKRMGCRGHWRRPHSGRSGPGGGYFRTSGRPFYGRRA